MAPVGSLGHRAFRIRAALAVNVIGQVDDLQSAFAEGARTGAAAGGHGEDGCAKRLAQVQEMLNLVWLEHASLTRYPHAFSDGQRQRIGIARALVLRPSFAVCDESVSALDVSVQA